MRRAFCYCLSLLLLFAPNELLAARKAKTRTPVSPQKELEGRLNQYFVNYKKPGQLLRSPAHLKSLNINDSLQIVEICADTHFGEQVFTPILTDKIYDDISAILPDSLKTYKTIVKTGGWEIEQLIPNRLMPKEDTTRTWGPIKYEGRPWVSNASLPYRISRR